MNDSLFEEGLGSIYDIDDEGFPGPDEDSLEVAISRDTRDGPLSARVGRRDSSGIAMINGLRTAIYAVSDLDAGKAWYGRVLDHRPYFDEPFYVGFSVGGFELGLVPDGTPGSAGVQVFWGVLDAVAELARLTDLGASVDQAVKAVGDGIKVAVVKDPFGNVFGIIENPHFDPKAVG